MAVLGPDTALEGVLPQESVAPPPPAAKASRSTAGAGADAGAQEAAKEATPEDSLAHVGSDVGGGSQAEETTMGGPDVIEVEVVSVLSGEPFDLAEVAQPSYVEGPTTLMRVG
jgi:hypothetical protein